MPIIELKPIELIHYPDGRKGLDRKKTFWLNAAVVDSFKEGIDHWTAVGGKFFVTETFRSIEAQAKLKKQKPGLACRPGWSMHGHGRACDFDVSSISMPDKDGKIIKGRVALVMFYEHMQRFGWYTIFNFPSQPINYQSRESWHIQKTDPVGIKSRVYLETWANTNGGIAALMKLEYKKI